MIAALSSAQLQVFWFAVVQSVFWLAAVAASYGRLIAGGRPGTWHNVGLWAAHNLIKNIAVVLHLLYWPDNLAMRQTLTAWANVISLHAAIVIVVYWIIVWTGPESSPHSSRPL